MDTLALPADILRLFGNSVRLRLVFLLGKNGRKIAEFTQIAQLLARNLPKFCHCSG